MNEEGFYVPSCAVQVDRQFGKVGDYDQSQFERGSIMAVWGREYMLSTQNAEENWIGVDDDIILDGYVSVWGYSGSNKYDLFIVKDYQTALPFTYIEVLNDQQWFSSEDTKKEIRKVELNFSNYEFKNFSIMIDSFYIEDENSFHDIRLVFIQKTNLNSTSNESNKAILGSGHRFYVNRSRNQEEVLSLKNMTVRENTEVDKSFWNSRKGKPYLYNCNDYGNTREIVSSDSICFSHATSSNTAEVRNYILFENDEVVNGYSFLGQTIDSNQELLYYKVVERPKPGASYRLIAAPNFDRLKSGSLSSNIIVVEDES